MEERQRQERTSQRAGQEKEVKGKAKNGRELESNTHTQSRTHWDGRGRLYVPRSLMARKQKQKTYQVTRGKKQNAKDIKKGREERNTVTQNDWKRRERRPFECD